MMLFQYTMLIVAMWIIPRHLTAQSVATVGAGEITDRQIERRVAIERAYGGTIAREAALASIITDRLDSEVARSLGLFPDSTMLASFSAHVDRNTKAPEILAAIKRIFDGDTIAYRQEYLSPRVVNMQLHSYFARDTTIHAASRRAIERAYALVASGSGFETAATHTRLRYSVDSMSDRHASLPPELAHYASTEAMSPDPYVALVGRMQPGELFSTIVESDVDYRVVRVRERVDTLSVVETIIADKGEYDEWFRRIAVTIDMRIGDRELCQRIVRRYPDIWWVRRLRGSR